jgi:Family of unknown function (DUF6279)
MLVALVLPACSAIKLAYSQAPDLTYWWLDGYFDFNGAQTPPVRDGIGQLFAWHRTSELPKVAALLQKSQALMPSNLSSAQACGVFDEARVLAVAVVDKTLPIAADIAPTFTAEQIAFLQRKQKKTNDEYTRDNITATAAERSAKRLKSAISRSEMIYGKLEDAQIAAIERAIAESSFDPVRALKERQQRQKEAVDMLTSLAVSKASPAASQAVLRAYVARIWVSTDPSYRAYSEKLFKESCDSFASVHASTTPAQRARAAQTLQNYAQDMRTLAGQN